MKTLILKIGGFTAYLVLQGLDFGTTRYGCTIAGKRVKNNGDILNHRGTRIYSQIYNTKG